MNKLDKIVEKVLESIDIGNDIWIVDTKDQYGIKSTSYQCDTRCLLLTVTDQNAALFHKGKKLPLTDANENVIIKFLNEKELIKELDELLRQI